MSVSDEKIGAFHREKVSEALIGVKQQTCSEE